MGILDLSAIKKVENKTGYNGEDIRAIARSLNRGENLFNKADIISGKRLYNGAVIDTEGYFIAYIPVDININSKVTQRSFYTLAQCDESKNIISGTYTYTGLSHSLVNGVRYVLLCGLLSAIDNVCLVYGETTIPQSIPFDGATSVNARVLGGNIQIDGEPVVNPVLYPSELASYDRNLIDNTRWINGKALNTDGTVINSSSSAITDWIPVNPKVSKTLNFKMRNGTSGNVTIFRVTLYRKDFSFISQVASISSNTPQITITDETAYIRFWLQNVNTTYGYEGVLKYGIFPIAYFDLKPYSGGMPGNLITPDDIIPMYRFGGTKDSPTFVVTADAGACVTTYIPVKPNTKYFVQSAQDSSNANSRFAHFFGRNKEDLGVLYTGNNVGYDNIITTPYNAYFVVFSFMNTWWDKNDSRHFIGMIETENWDGKVGTVVAEDDVVRASILDGPFPCGRNKILGVYGDFIAQMNFDNTRIRFSASGWDAKPYYVGSTSKPGGWAEYELNSTNFPGYVSGGFSQVVFFTKSNGSIISGIGCLVFGASDNKIWYCADVSDVANLTFAVPNIWDMKGNKSWRLDDSIATNKKTDSKGVTRYRKVYPSDIASRLNQFMWHNGPLWMTGAGGQYSRGVLFGNYSDHSWTNPSPNCLYYTDNGEDIYVMYEFGATPKRYKTAGDSAVKTRTSTLANYCAGDVVDVSDAALFPSGSAFSALTMRKRYSIIPSAEEGDPTAIFEYDENGVAVSSASGTAFTLTSTSGFQIGDIVILEGTATGGYAKLLTTSIDATTKVGNGPVFVITGISGNNATLADIVGNPKNNLFCRHIHGVTEFGQGICIYTGEEYPESWFVYMNPYFGDIANGTNPNNTQWETDTIHLNSSPNAFQRALGIILRPDGKCVYIADSNQPQSSKLTVRGKDIKMGNFGVIVFPLEDIDDNSKALTKINGVNAGYALYNLGNILFYADYYGKTFYSVDWGDSWKYLGTMSPTKSFFIGWGKNAKTFYFNQTRGTQFCIEIK